MYATLENRQMSSAIAWNAQKINRAIENNGIVRPWAAMLILTSAVSALDYVAGTIWRIPVALFYHDMSSASDLLKCACKALCCAIGIIIFSIVGIVSPEKAISLLEYFELCVKKKRFDMDEAQGEIVSKEINPSIIDAPEPVPEVNLVAWNKVGGILQNDLVYTDEDKILFGDHEKKVLKQDWEGPVFPKDRAVFDKVEVKLYTLLEHTRYQGKLLYQEAALLLGLSPSDSHIRLIKNIIHTVYPRN